MGLGGNSAQTSIPARLLYIRWDTSGGVKEPVEDPGHTKSGTKKRESEDSLYSWWVVRDSNTRPIG